MAGLVFSFACGVLMIVRIVLRLISGPSPVRSLKCSELIQEIDRKNVRDAKVLTLKNTTEITGHLLHSDEVISVSSMEVNSKTPYNIFAMPKYLQPRLNWSGKVRLEPTRLPQA